MSHFWTLMFTALGGVLAGLCTTVVVLCRFLDRLDTARRQVAAAEQRVAAAHDLARRDDTTGLPNRLAFLEQLRAALADGDPVGVVMIDLDDFKAVNDAFGHETGNDLLTAVGLRLAGLPAPVRLAARLSGDEFVLLVDAGADRIGAAARAAWRAIVSRPIPVTDHKDWEVGASVGYATDGASARDLLRAADAAMYQAKALGGGVCDSAVASSVLPAHTRCRDARRH